MDDIVKSTKKVNIYALQNKNKNKINHHILNIDDITIVINITILELT
jgi:hypothetical protein